MPVAAELNLLAYKGHTTRMAVRNKVAAAPVRHIQSCHKDVAARLRCIETCTAHMYINLEHCEGIGVSIGCTLQVIDERSFALCFHRQA